MSSVELAVLQLLLHWNCLYLYHPVFELCLYLKCLCWNLLFFNYFCIGTVCISTILCLNCSLFEMSSLELAVLQLLLHWNCLYLYHPVFELFFI